MSNTNNILDFKVDRKTIQKGAINSVIIHVLFKLKGFITIPIITYYLLPEDMGIYNLIIVTANLLMPLFYMNLGDGPVVFLAQEKSRSRIKDMYNTIVSSSFLFYLVFSSIFIIFIARFGGDKKYLYFAVPVIFSLIFYKLSSNIFVVFLKTTIAVTSKFFVELIGTILTIGFLVIGLSWDAMIYAVIVSNIVVAAYIYKYAKKEFPLKFLINKDLLQQFLKISLPLLPVFFFSWIIQSSDSYFLLYFKGEDDVGKYAVVYALSSVVLMLRMALNFFWFPLSSKLWVENREDYKKFFSMIFFIIATVLMMAVLLFEVNSKIVMQILVRKAEYREAYVIMGVIAFAFGLQVLITLLTGPLYSNKNTTSIFLSYFTGGIVNCILNFILIPPMGIWGAAISTGISYILVIVLMSVLNYRMTEFRFLDKRLLFTSCLFLPVWFGLSVFRENIEIWHLLLTNVVLVLFLGTVIYLWVLNKEDKKYLHSTFRDYSLRGNARK